LNATVQVKTWARVIA